MKKLVLALLVGLMVVAGSASMAAAEITVGGDIELRYDVWHNLNLTDTQLNAGDTHTQNFFAQRVMLNVDAKITEGLEAFIELETSNEGLDERVWGVNHTGAFDTFGDHIPGNTVSAVNYQGETVAIRQAWINFMIPGAPVGIKIGHQPLALGHGISLDTHRMGTDAILLYAKPIPQLLVAGVYSKVVEQSNGTPNASFDSPILANQLLGTVSSGGLNGSEHHDADVYAALANYTWMENNTVGINWLYVHDAAVPQILFGDGVLHLHNIGLTADGVIGPVNYKAEVDYQNIDGTANGVDFSLGHGWAGMVGASTKLDIVTVGLEVAYGTGTTNSDLLGSSARTYLSPYGETSYNYAFLYNDKIGQGPRGVGGGLGLGDGTGGFGLANTGYIKLSAAAAPIDRLNVGVDVMYLNASAVAVPGQKRDLGWEIDANVGYKIYDNLKLDVQGGVFIPGDWYKGAPGFVNFNDLTTAYGLETKLNVKF